MIDALNKKCDRATGLIEENKGMLIEKLGIFENGIIQELKEATEHLDLKAYEESFAKIEEDINNLYKEFSQFRDDMHGSEQEIGEWR